MTIYEKKAVKPNEGLLQSMDFSPPESQEEKDKLEATQRLNDFLQESRFDPEIKYPDDVAAIEIRTDEGRKIPAFGLNALTLVKGKAKSMKSTAIATMLGSCSVEGGMFSWGKKEKRRRVLWIDTEQKKKHVKRIYEFLRSDKNNDILCFRGLKANLEEKVQLALHAMSVHADTNSMVVIDGIVDLCPDFNDPEKSQNFISLLMQASEENNQHIICVLHENGRAGDNKARGHLGTIMRQKAELVLRTSIDDKAKTCVNIEVEASRNEPIPNIVVNVDFRFLNKTRMYKEGDIEIVQQREKDTLEYCRRCVHKSEDRKVRKATFLNLLKTANPTTSRDERFSTFGRWEQDNLITVLGKGRSMWVSMPTVDKLNEQDLFDDNPPIDAPF